MRQINCGMAASCMPPVVHMVLEVLENNNWFAVDDSSGTLEIAARFQR